MLLDKVPPPRPLSLSLSLFLYFSLSISLFRKYARASSLSLSLSFYMSLSPSLSFASARALSLSLSLALLPRLSPPVRARNPPLSSEGGTYKTVTQNSVLGFQVQVLKLFKPDPSSLPSGRVLTLRVGCGSGVRSKGLGVRVSGFEVGIFRLSGLGSELGGARKLQGYLAQKKQPPSLRLP